MGGDDVQASTQKHRNNRYALPHPCLQVPDTPDWKGKNTDVRYEIRDAVPNQRSFKVNTVTRKQLIPSLCDGRALENCDKINRDQPGEGDASEYIASDADVADGEDTVVHEEDREFNDCDGRDIDWFEGIEELWLRSA
jgi:hypothetical protein